MKAADNSGCSHIIISRTGVNRIKIVPLPNNKRDIKKFVKFSWKIYERDPYWVPPLIIDQINFIHKGVYHDTGIIQTFMVYRGNEPVGRIIAHYDRGYNERFNCRRGCFGFFECIDDPDVSNALLDACRDWLISQGMDEIHGPLNFTLYDSSGLLIENFQCDPVVELPHNPPYYQRLLEDYGFEKDIDWYAYRFKGEQDLPEIMYRAREKVRNNKMGISFRFANLKEYWEEVGRLREVFNRAWEDNWGHMPLSRKHFDHFAKELKPIIKSELVVIAEKDGELVGYILSVPDANPALKRANGRLLPFGLIRMLWGLRRLRKIKIYMMGVVPEFRGYMIEHYLIAETYEQARKLGYEEADISLIVENNKNLIGLLDKAGAEKYKTIRHYRKSIR